MFLDAIKSLTNKNFSSFQKNSGERQGHTPSASPLTLTSVLIHAAEARPHSDVFPKGQGAESQLDSENTALSENPAEKFRQPHFRKVQENS